jgi:hypothetical protein
VVPPSASVVLDEWRKPEERTVQDRQEPLVYFDGFGACVLHLEPSQKLRTFEATTLTNFFDKFSFSILDRESNLGQQCTSS